MIARFIFILLTCAPRLPGSYGTLTVFPQNTAVISGSQATFMCTSNLTSPHAWTWTSSSMPSSIVFNQSSCVLSNASYSQIFSLDSTSPDTCNLIVKTASLSEVGRYTCGDLGSNPPNTASAMLTVLESGPICSITNTTDNAVYNSSSNVLQMECSVSYSTYSSSNEPQLSWSHSPGPSIAFNTTFSYSLLEAPLTIPQTSSETCTLSFNPPTGLSGTNYATNAPSFTSTCNTPVVYPMWFTECSAVSTVSLSSDNITPPVPRNGAAGTGVTAIVLGILLGISVVVNFLFCFLFFRRKHIKENKQTEFVKAADNPSFCEPVYQNTNQTSREYETLDHSNIPETNTATVYQELNYDGCSVCLNNARNN